MINPADLLMLIRRRRSIYPPAYTGLTIPKSHIDLCLEAAHWAPNHKRTEPWRFVVLQEQAKDTFAARLSQWYDDHTPSDQYAEIKKNKLVEKPLLSDTIILIGYQRDLQDRLPEWEELAATAMAVQNMWLMAASLGIGAYWSSHPSIDAVPDWYQWPSGQICLGYFYMGWSEDGMREGQRGSLAEKVTWLTD